MVEDLVADHADHIEGVSAANGVDEHVAVDADEVLVVEDGVFVLAGRVDDFHRVVMVLVVDNLAERVFDGRVVGVDKVTVDILDRKGAFP